MSISAKKAYDASRKVIEGDLEEFICDVDKRIKNAIADGDMVIEMKHPNEGIMSLAMEYYVNLGYSCTAAFYNQQGAYSCKLMWSHPRVDDCDCK